MELQFKITNDYISEVGLKIAPVADSVNHLYAAFEFDDAWDGAVKTAIFGGGGKTYHVILQSDNRCVIPWEVLTGPCFTVSAFGITETERITATELKIPLAPSGYKNGQSPSEPSDSAYTQLLQMLSWVITNKAALTKFAEGSTDVPDMINIPTEDGSITLREAIVAEAEARAAADTALEQNKADKTSLLTKADKEYNSGFVGGKNAKLNAVGGAAAGLNAQASSGGAIGNGAKARDGGAIGFGAVAIYGGAMGVAATVTSGGAIGDSSCAGDGFSGGYAARVATDPEFDYIDAIQLGQGTNNTPKTLQIYDYCLMNADGTIPPERLNDYYKKSYLDDKFSGYDTQMMMMSEAIMGKAELYDFNQLSKTVAAKADRPTITTPTGASAELADNTEARFGEVASLTLTLPSNTTGEFGDYISSVVFTSGATATSLTYPDTITMIGTDCIDGVFAPVASKRYTVIVAYDGAGLVGYVAGYEVSA